MRKRKTKGLEAKAIVTKEFDWQLFLMTILTSVIGIVIIYSATRTTGSNSNVIVQSASCFMGITAMLLLCFFDYEQFGNATKYIYLFSVFILINNLIVWAFKF